MPFADIFLRQLIRALGEAVPRIFELFDAMGDHDKAFDMAWKSVVAIGGPDVLEHCRRAVKSPNRRSRKAAMLIMKDLALPECRDVAQSLLADEDSWIGHAALNVLKALGLTEDDGPAIVRALETLESRIASPPPDPPINGFSWDIVTSLISALDSLEVLPADAAPVLERLAGQVQFLSIHEAAEAALAKARTHKRNPEH